MENTIIPFKRRGGGLPPAEPPQMDINSPELLAFRLRNVSARLERIQASLMVAEGNLKGDDQYLVQQLVDLCESSMSDDIAEIDRVADALAPDRERLTVATE
jgi:hypothetical protein